MVAYYCLILFFFFNLIFSNSLLSLPIQKLPAMLDLQTFPIRFTESLWKRGLNLLLWWLVRKCFIVFLTISTCSQGIWSESECYLHRSKASACIRNFPVLLHLNFFYILRILEQLFTTLQSMLEYMNKFVGEEISLCTPAIVPSFLLPCLTGFQHSI